jgi:tagaturonate epimerase
MESWYEYPRSRVEKDGTAYWMARRDGQRVLVVEGDASGFEGDQVRERFIAPLSAGNAQALRGRLPWLRPQVLGRRLSVGTGDRLGLATPGHLRAVRAHALARASAGAAPIVAQQSMRENERTGRSPQQVMDDAMWGVFQEGWRAPWGADADHLKSTEHVDLCAAAGYTFYTVDPGDHVDDQAHTAAVDTLRQKVDTLPWDALEDSVYALCKRYLDRSFQVEEMAIEFDEESLLRAAAKYGRAIAHTTRMYRHLAGALPEGEFELEVSVDETATPTSPLEHFFIASELLRLGVQWVSLAPRYVGRFEKGADYIPASGIAGDLDEFDRSLACHAAIARALGPYKLSIHTGSDKFSVYPIFRRHAGHLVHLKTAGTSYLEALRAIARVDPGFFREILTLALEHYEQDRATYHVSGETSRVPRPETLADGDLPGLLDQHDARQVLHVTFGSALDRYRDRILRILDAHEEEHYAALETHFLRHLEPFG